MGLCILILQQLILNLFPILSIISKLIISQSTKAALQSFSSDRPLSARKLTDDTKLTYLKALVTSKARNRNCGVYTGHLATKTLAAACFFWHAHLDQLNTTPPLKMHKSENVIRFSSALSGHLAIFKSLPFNDDLKSVNLLNQALSKLPPNLKEAWSMHTVRHNWQRSTLRF